MPWLRGLESLWRSLVSGWKDPVFRTLAVAVLSILAVATRFHETEMGGSVGDSPGRPPAPPATPEGVPAGHVDGSAANSDNSTRD